MKPKNTLKIKTVLTWLSLILGILMGIIALFSIIFLGKNNCTILGYKAFIVRSDSMKSVNGDESKGYFKAGDLIFVKMVEPSTLEAGDIISYVSTSPESFGETITHMIKEKTTSADGEQGFITYGTTTGAIDREIVTFYNVIGKYQGRISDVGKFFNFLKTPIGYICVFLPFTVIIVLQGWNTIQVFQAFKQHNAKAQENSDLEKDSND